MKYERNRPCPCGSGKKFKRCCGSPAHARLPARPFDALGSYRAALEKQDRDAYPIMGTLLAATHAVYEFLATPEQAVPFDSFFGALMRYSLALESVGVPSKKIPEFVVPRLAFDLVCAPHRHTPAEHFLLRFGADLPGEAVAALKALLDGTDELVEVQEREGTLWLQKLGSSKARPWGAVVEARPGEVFLGRLVEFRGEFVLFCPEGMPDVTRANHRTARAFFLAPGRTMRRDLELSYRLPGKDLHVLSVVSRALRDEFVLQALESHSALPKPRRGREERRSPRRTAR